ncbi:hypothetical protein ACVXHA_25010 [Escherichia coli]
MQELIDYIGQSHYLPGDEALNCDESEARVKAHLTCLHTRMPFDPAKLPARRTTKLCSRTATPPARW